MAVSFNPTPAPENLVSVKFGKVEEVKDSVKSDDVPIVAVKKKVKFEEAKTTVTPLITLPGGQVVLPSMEKTPEMRQYEMEEFYKRGDTRAVAHNKSLAEEVNSSFYAY